MRDGLASPNGAARSGGPRLGRAASGIGRGFAHRARGTPSAACPFVADEYQTITIPTERGSVEARIFDAGPTKSGAIFVGSEAGGYSSPANGLYGRLGSELSHSGITSSWVRYRDAHDVIEAAYDVRAAIRMLTGRGIARIGLVGHSFGGAVVITAAETAREVKALVTLATQGYGTDPIAYMVPRPILLVHGTADELVPPTSSVETFRLAREPKELRLLDGATHGLDESSGTVHLLVRSWLERWLASDVIPLSRPTAG
jgi:hypothetical protein